MSPSQAEITVRVDTAELERLRDETLRALAQLAGAVAALSERVARLERERRP